MPSRRRSHFVLLAAPHVLLSTLALLRVATTPDERGFGTHEQLGFGPCRVKEWIGVPCPTCGVTTSASHLVRGDVVESWATQPLGIVGTLFTLVIVAVSWRVHARGGELGEWWVERGRRVWSLLALAVVSCWIAVLVSLE